MVVERTPTGIGNFDSIINGGFPRGSLILLAGNPGTGKTVFSAQFLWAGAEKYGENGVYVSFAETKETFYSWMANFGFNFEKLEKEGKFKFLDMITVKEEGVSFVLEKIIHEVEDLKAKRLVIDSFSAMTQAFKEPIDARITLHVLLGRIVRQLSCTTILIAEIPTGQEKVGLDVEEFVADGVIILRRGGEDRVREIEIAKLRGTKIKQSIHMFTLEGGFNIMLPFKVKTLEKPEKWKPIPDREGYFSTGSPDLDKVFGGGYPRGSYVILEADMNVPLSAICLFEFPLALNFLAQGRGVAILPSGGTDSEEIKQFLTSYIGEELFNKLVRIYEEVKPGKNQLKPYIALMRGGATNLERDVAAWMQTIINLREETGKPVLQLFGYDTLESKYAENLEKLFNQIGTDITECKAQESLALAVARPGLRITQRALNMVDTHLRLIERYGCILFYGVKPRTGVYAVECDVSKGYPMLKLTPMV
jgi:KaiC/GvpD/RAD55 family RecA-like ATPase